MSLLRDVVAELVARSIPHALIGAAAMAIHGVSRATADVDLLVVDTRALAREAWSDFERRGDELRLLKGDFDDPLAGSVRLVREESIVDVVVGRYAWQRELIDAAVHCSTGEVEVPVVRPAGLVLLKLHAGSARDAWDARALLEALEDGPSLVEEVERLLPALPAESRRLWERIRAE